MPDMLAAAFTTLLLWWAASLALLPVAVANVIGSCCCTDEECQICVNNNESQTCNLETLTGSADFETSPGSVDISAADTFVRTQTAADSGTTAMRASANVIGVDNGDELDLAIKVVDEDNCWIARLTVGSPGTLEILQRVSGTDTVRASVAITAAAAQSHVLAICYDENGKVQAYCQPFGGDNTRIICITTPSTTGLKSGVGTGALTSAAGFSEWLFYYGYAAAKTACTVCVTDDCQICDDDEVCPFTVTAGTATGTGTDTVTVTAANTHVTCDLVSDGASFVHATVNASPGTSGDSPYVFVQGSDASNYWQARWTVGSHLRIYQVSGGTATQRATVTATGTAATTINICYGEDRVVARLGTGEYCSYTTTTNGTATKGGFGCVAVTTSVAFSAFRYEYGETDDRDCVPICYADCGDYHCNLDVTFTGFSELSPPNASSCGDCTNNNATFSLPFLSPADPACGTAYACTLENCKWCLSLPDECDAPNSPTVQGVDIQAGFQNIGGGDYRLCVKWSTTGSGGDNTAAVWYTNESVTSASFVCGATYTLIRRVGSDPCGSGPDVSFCNSSTATCSVIGV